MKYEFIPADLEDLPQFKACVLAVQYHPNGELLPAEESTDHPLFRCDDNALQESINPIEVYLDRLKSAKSKETQRYIINGILRRLYIDPRAGVIPVPWNLLLSPKVLNEVLIAATIEEKSNSYKNNIRAAFRGIARAAYTNYLIDPRQLAAIQDMPYDTVQLPPDRPVLDPADIQGLVEYCLKLDTVAGLRDACLVGIAFSSGLRVSELAALSIEHFPRGIKDLSYFRYKGKGDSQLEKYLPQDTQLQLKEWLIARMDAGADPNEGPIFYAIDRHDTMNIKRRGMTRSGIYDIFMRRSKAYCDQQLRPHDFRRSIITWFLDQGYSPEFVASWSGHKNTKTLVDNYDQKKSRRRQEMANQIKYLNVKPKTAINESQNPAASEGTGRQEALTSHFSE